MAGVVAPAAVAVGADGVAQVAAQRRLGHHAASSARPAERRAAAASAVKITHRFVDQASGATLDRPGLQEALDAARGGAFDVLLVYRIDRLTRSIVGLMTIVEELEAAGVALKSATEPIDTPGPVGRVLLQLLGIFAEFERNRYRFQ